MRIRKVHFSKASITSLLLIPFLISIAACDGALSPPKPSPGPTAGEEAPINSDNPAEPSENQSDTPQPKPPIPVQEDESASLKIYWLTAKGEDLALSASPLELDGDKPEAEQLTQALERLMQGPANANVSSAIPENTKLNKLSVKNDGVHVDLSKDFTTGGGSLSMQGRLGQVIYTASSIKPKTPVWISIDGEPLTVLGGEGLEVSQPITREEFGKEFSI